LPLREKNNIDLAMGYFDKATKIDPNFAKAWAGLADAHLLTWQSARVPVYIFLPKAREVVEKALALDDNLAEAHASLGYVLAWELKQNLAVKEFERALAIKPNYVLAYAWLGHTYAERMLNKAKGIETNIKGLVYDPMNLVLNINLSFCYAQSGQKEAAKKQILDTVHYKQTTSSRAMRACAQILYSIGEYDQAMARIDKALEMDPDASFDLTDRAAAIYQSEGQFDKALELARRNVELYPQFDAFFRLEMVLRASEVNDYEGNKKVIEEFEGLIKQYPQSPGAHAQLGKAYQNAGEYKKAIAHHNKAIQIDPNNPGSYYELALTYEAMGDNDQAEEQFKQAIECCTFTSYLLANPINKLRNLYLGQGEFEKAYDVYEKALERYPDWAFLYDGLGKLYRDYYEYEKAITLLEKAVERFPDDIQLITNIIKR